MEVSTRATQSPEWMLATCKTADKYLTFLYVAFLWLFCVQFSGLSCDNAVHLPWLGLVTEATWLGLGKNYVFAFKYLFWLLQTCLETSWILVKKEPVLMKNRFHQHGTNMDGEGPTSCQKHPVFLATNTFWNCRKVSLKISCGITNIETQSWTALTGLAAFNPATRPPSPHFTLTTGWITYIKDHCLCLLLCVSLVFVVIKLIWKEASTVASTEVKSLRGVAPCYYSWAFIAAERKNKRQSMKREAIWRDVYNILNKSRNPLPQSYTQCESSPAESPSFETSLLACTSETENSLGVSLTPT